MQIHNHFQHQYYHSHYTNNLFLKKQQKMEKKKDRAYPARVINEDPDRRNIETTRIVNNIPPNKKRNAFAS